MKENDEEERMENPKVKTILTLKFQMKDKSLDDNYKDKELVLHNEMEYEIQNEESVIQKFEVGTSVVSAHSVDLLA
jgi:hypothetical protein